MKVGASVDAIIGSVDAIKGAIGSASVGPSVGTIVVAIVSAVVGASETAVRSRGPASYDRWSIVPRSVSRTSRSATSLTFATEYACSIAYKAEACSDSRAYKDKA